MVYTQGRKVNIVKKSAYIYSYLYNVVHPTTS